MRQRQTGAATRTILRFWFYVGLASSIGVTGRGRPSFLGFLFFGVFWAFPPMGHPAVHSRPPLLRFYGGRVRGTRPFFSEFFFRVSRPRARRDETRPWKVSSVMNLTISAVSCLGRRQRCASSASIVPVTPRCHPCPRSAPLMPAFSFVRAFFFSCFGFSRE